MLSCSKDNLRRKRPSYYIYSNNWSHPLSISRLKRFCMTLLSPRFTDNFSSWYHTHLEASFIHIIDILWYNPILFNCLLNSCKPSFNKLRILTFGMLIIIFPGIFWSQFWVVFNEVVDPMASNSNSMIWLRQAGWEEKLSQVANSWQL